MKFVDVSCQDRTDSKPDQTIIVFENASFAQQDFTVNKVELCLYREKTDANLGIYSLITSVVHTDKGCIEMTYDEGFRGTDSLKSAAQFLSSTLGVSGVVLRSIIALNDLIKT